MLNWLGQDVVPGVYVYRGARDGNTSSFKVGHVTKVTESKGTARVSWRVELWGGKVHLMDTDGSPSIDTLVVLDKEHAERVIGDAEREQALRQRNAGV